MIEIKNLTKEYGAVRAVNNISLSINEGETLALVGTSGCGKTTTLKMLNRLLEPTEGAVYINGKDATDYNPTELRRKIGYIFQDIGLFPHYTVEENIGVVPNLLGWGKNRISLRVSELLERLKLLPNEYATKYPHQLSGGQQQRVGIARALAADPPIMLMDEPFGALDPITRKEIRKDFLELEELYNKTSVLVTHDIEEAFEMADLICILDKGEIQQIGSPKELLFKPANSFIEEFLKDKQMQLELQTIKIADIFNQMPNKNLDDSEFLEIKPKQSVFEALNVFTNKSINSKEGMTIYQGQSKYYNVSDMLEIFRKFILGIKSNNAL